MSWPIALACYKTVVRDGTVFDQDYCVAVKGGDHVLISIVYFDGSYEQNISSIERQKQ